MEGLTTTSRATLETLEQHLTQLPRSEGAPTRQEHQDRDIQVQRHSSATLWRMTKKDEVKLDTFLHKHLQRVLKNILTIESYQRRREPKARTCTISEQIRRRRRRPGFKGM